MNGNRAIISAIVIILANILAMWGISLDTELWVNGLCAIVALALDAYGIWRNHNFTPEAQEAQKVLDELKAKKVA